MKKTLRWHDPKLLPLNRTAHGDVNCFSGTSAGSYCFQGHSAGGLCFTGTAAFALCYNGGNVVA